MRKSEEALIESGIAAHKEAERYEKLAIDHVESRPSINWEQRRYELAKAAMQAVITSRNRFIINGKPAEDEAEIAFVAVSQADAVINQLKGGRPMSENKFTPGAIHPRKRGE